MKNLYFTLVVLFSSMANAAANTDTEVAMVWLKLVDGGDYMESWQQAAPSFQQQVTSSKWAQAMHQVREPLGKVIARKVNNVSQQTSLSGMPDGEYTVITLLTRFENKQAAVETLILGKIENEWRTIGYFIR